MGHDAKPYHAALEVRRSGGLFSPRVERLVIARRDRTGLVDRLAKQVDAVARELEGSAHTCPSEAHCDSWGPNCFGSAPALFAAYRWSAAVAGPSCSMPPASLQPTNVKPLPSS